MAPSATASREASRQLALSTIRAEPKSRTAKAVVYPMFSRDFPCLDRGEPISSEGSPDFRSLRQWGRFGCKLRENGAALVESATGARAVSMRAVLDIVIIILDLYTWLLIASAIL